MSFLIRWPGVALNYIFIFLSIFGLILGSPADGVAKGKPEHKKPTSGWIFSASTWLSTGHTESTFGGSSRFSGDPISVLNYQDVDSYTLELSGEYRNKNWFTRGLIGYGTVSGTLIDDDFISAEAAAFFSTSIAGEHRFSRSRGDLKGESLHYATFDAGRNFLKTKKFRIRGYLGYLFLKEKLQSLGHTQLECTSVFLCRAVGVTAGAGMLSISNTAEWHAMKMGMGFSFQVLKKIKIELDGAFIPLAFLDSEDIHHLRTDLSQSPSFLDTGQGLGYSIDALVIYNVWSRFFIKAGYRYWSLNVDDGVSTFFRSDGTSGKSALTGFDTYRHGAVVGVELRF